MCTVTDRMNQKKTWPSPRITYGLQHTSNSLTKLVVPSCAWRPIAQRPTNQKNVRVDT